MCYLVFTNYQREGAVSNMTMGEFYNAETKGDLKVVSVWNHKTANKHGSARIVIPQKIYQIIQDHFPSSSEESSLVFKTEAGTRITHIGTELSKLGETFGKKFAVSVHLF